MQRDALASWPDSRSSGACGGGQPSQAEQTNGRISGRRVAQSAKLFARARLMIVGLPVNSINSIHLGGRPRPAGFARARRTRLLANHTLCGTTGGVAKRGDKWRCRCRSRTSGTSATTSSAATLPVARACGRRSRRAIINTGPAWRILISRLPGGQAVK